MKKEFAVFALAVLALNVFGMSFKTIDDNRIQVDGRLDEPEWGAAEKAGGFSFLKAKNPTGATPRSQTEFRLLSDSSHIYIGITCYDAHMDKLKASTHGETANPWLDDVVEIFISPEKSVANFYQFVVSAGGGFWQMYYEEKGVTRPNAYKPFYQARVAHNADAWTLEIQIPFDAFFLTRAEFWKSTWLLNISRVTHDGELTTWSALNTAFNETQLFKTVANAPRLAADSDYAIQNAVFKSRSSADGELQITVFAPRATECVLETEAGRRSGNISLTKGENTLLMKPFKADGSTRLLPFRLFDSDGRKLAECRYPVQFNFVPLQTVLTAPSYSDTFFPGQDAGRLAGKIMDRTDSRHCIITAGTRRHQISLLNHEGAFDIPLNWDGTDAIDVVFESASGARIVRKIRRIAATTDNRTMYSIEDGTLKASGKPFFLLGWYGDGGWACGKAFLAQYPTPAAKHPYNFKGWVVVEPNRLIPGIEAQEAVTDRKVSERLLKKIHEVIEENRSRDFSVYYLSDEPECRGVSPAYLKQVYNFIKSEDPTHPVMIISRDPVRYMECCDIMSMHPYTNPLRDDSGNRKLRVSVRDISNLCRKAAAAAGPRHILMLTPQIFSYGFNNIYADYPTFDETNASIWALVANGGKGIFPYIWCAHIDRSDLNLGSDYIFESLNLLEPWIAVNAFRKPLAKDNPIIDAALFENTDNTILLAVNPDTRIQNVTLSAPELQKIDAMPRFRAPGQVKINQGSVTLELAPYEAAILTRVPVGADAPTMPQLRQKIDAMEQARKSRGNLLFERGRDIELSFAISQPYELVTAMAQQETLFDGILNNAAWLPRQVQGEPWYELAFPKFIPRFSQAVIHGNQLGGTVFKIWKYGKWLVPEVRRTATPSRLELDFGKTLSTVKIRLEFPEKGDVELYEFELLK